MSNNGVGNCLTIPLFFFKERIGLLEKDFQAKLIKELKDRYPDSIIFKNDTIQGLPDLTILYKNHWAFLECKRGPNEKHQPNQDYYISKAEGMSFGRFICPENKEEVLHELQQTFEL